MAKWELVEANLPAHSVYYDSNVGERFNGPRFFVDKYRKLRWNGQYKYKLVKHD